MTELDQHLDSILKASGSGLKNYSMQKTLDDMRNALKAALVAEREACAKVCEARAKDFLALYTRYQDEQDNGSEIAATQCARYIRARGEA